MPEIDTDLFQVVALVLLAVAVIVLLVVLSMLDRIRKMLAEGPPRAEAPLSAYVEPATSAYGGVAQPAAAQPAAAAATPVAQPARTQATPAAAQATPAAVQPAATTQPQPVAAAAEPSDQPFERDGRWWFRRGNELLVYDEQTGQWVASAQQPASVAAAAPAAAAPAAAGGTAVMPTPATGEAGGMWKCPTCGAVNGSTATSCRMCFTARP